MAIKDQQVQELLYQALETELGGQKIYETAITCAQNSDLSEEWQKYLEETSNHHQILLETFGELSIDPEKMTPGREVVRHLGESLVRAMQMARESNPEAAEIVATECVVLAETKDHENWQLISRVAEEASGKLAKTLKHASEQVGDQEDEHLYHTKGWARELWLQSLGVPALLPPPEEEKGVKTAIGAARAEQSREDMLK